MLTTFDPATELAWLYFMVDGTGIFRHTKSLPVCIYDGATVRGNVAELNVVIPTGKAVLGIEYIFHKENDVWKLNFPSTMRVVEKIYAQNQRSSGLGYHQYAKQVVGQTRRS